MNRDEAERCVDIALAALKQGDAAKARRMLKKSLSMHPTERARALLESIEERSRDDDGNNNNQTASGPSGTSSESSARRRNVPETPAAETAEEEKTGEDDEDVIRVLECSEDYYAVFSLEKTASTDEIKKRYRKLALKMHPDRNSSPHAEDAFKVLGRAYACLSNEEKRRVYDKHGIDPDVQHAAGRPGGGGGFGGGPTYFRRGPTTFASFNEDIDPDELFRFFFGDQMFAASTGRGGGSPFFAFGPDMHFRRRRFYTSQRDGDDDDDDDNDNARRGRPYPRRAGVWQTLQALFPLIMLIGFFLVALRGFNNMQEQSYQDMQRLKSQQFTLQRTSLHTIRLVTPTLKVPYYVQKKPKNYKARTKLDDDVDRHYLSELGRECEYQSQLNNHGMRNKKVEVCSLLNKKKKEWANSRPKEAPSKPEATNEGRKVQKLEQQQQQQKEQPKTEKDNIETENTPSKDAEHDHVDGKRQPDCPPCSSDE